MKKTGRKLYGEYPDEQAVIEIIRLKARKRKGAERPLGPWEIARELNAEGYVSQVGRRWSGIQVKRILARSKAVEQPPAEEPEEIPQEKRKPPKVRLKARDYLTLAQMAKCRAVCPVRDIMLFDFLLATGLRAAELCALKIGHLGIIEKTQVDVYDGKGGVDRSIEIDEQLCKEIVKWLSLNRPGAGADEVVFLHSRNKPMTYKALYYRIKVIGRNAGLEDESKSKTWLHPHALRHTCGTHLYDYKKDLYFVQRQLGHKGVDTTQIYAHTPDTSKKEQVKAWWQMIQNADTSENTS